MFSLITTRRIKFCWHRFDDQSANYDRCINMEAIFEELKSWLGKCTNRGTRAFKADADSDLQCAGNIRAALC